MKEIQPKEVWFVKFPFEEDKTRYTQRPGIVLSINDEEACILTRRGSYDSRTQI